MMCVCARACLCVLDRGGRDKLHTDKGDFYYKEINFTTEKSASPCFWSLGKKWSYTRPNSEAYVISRTKVYFKDLLQQKLHWLES